MKSQERREQILQILAASDKPVSGASLANQMHVTRQVIVQDIALLRANGSDILSTNQGYLMQSGMPSSRVFKTVHSDEEVEEELSLIVDLGGEIKDTFVYHKVYGLMKGEMNIRSRRDIRTFMENIRLGKSSLLKNITSGYHYHTVMADDEQTLDEIQEQLSQRGFLAPLQDYEPVDFWSQERKLTEE